MATYVPLYKTLAAVKQYKPGYQLGSRKQGGLSTYEQALLPHVQEAEAQRERKIKWLQPIELVFDLLSRGQYMTANTAKQITRNIREGKPVLEGVPREAWEGITGKEKGDWGTLLWGGQDKGGEQFSGWAQKAGENLEKTWVGRRAKGAAALGLNILLDPTTYLGAGPARGAKTAAKEATEDAIKIATRKLAADVSERLAGQGVKELGGEVFEKGMQQALLKGGDAPQKFLAKHLGRDIDREMSQLIKRTQKETLRLPAAEVRKKMLGEAESALERTKTNKLDAMAQAGKPYAEAIDVLMDQAPELQDLSGIIKKIKSGEAYGGAGTRSLRFMRKEFGTSERYPALIHAWDRATEALAGSKVGTLFNNAWWALMNNPKSPLATIKKAFNIRTPYQQYLANLQLDKTAMGVYLRDEYARNHLEAVKGLKPEDKVALVDAWSQIEDIKDADIFDVMLKSGIEPKRAAQLQQAHVKIKAQLDGFDSWTRKKYAEDPSLFPNGPVGSRINYLPEVGKKPEGLNFFRNKTGISPVQEGFTKKRTTTRSQMEDLEKKVWRVMEPRLTDDQIEVMLITYNMGRYINMDLDQMILARAFAQARLQQNVAMIEQFRQFGLNLGDVKATDPVIAEALARGAPDFGLVNVPDPRLEGYLFDPSVADILKRATTIGESDATIRQFEKYLNSFTSWWKGWATLSPGFHFRNYYSNTVTGFLKHGTDWLNPDTQFRAGVATLYGLYGEDAFKYFSKMGLSEDAARQLLGQKIGDYSVGELAQLARQRGIITKATMGFDVAQGVEAFTKQANWNPLSKQFAPMGVSRDIGTIIESQPRFLSFLLDYKTSVGQGAATDAAIDWAGWEAKKWFIDYTDLSPFEQKVLKNVIPFYTWMRKNIANQITGMMEFKEMYSLIPKVMAGGPETDATPEYMRNVGYFPIRELLGSKEGFMQMLWPNLPYMDINKIPLKFEISEAGVPIPKFEGKEILNDILSNAHPVLKTAFEVLPEEGWDVYYRRPLGQEREAPRVLSKLSRVAAANPQLLQFLDGFLVNLGVEEGLSGKMDEKGRLMINAKLARVLDNNLPFLQKLNQYIELPEYLTEAVRSAREQTKDEKDTQMRAEKGLNVLSFYLGVKLKNIDEQAELSRQGDEILREAEESYRKERKGKPEYQQARLRYVQSRLLRKRQLGLR